MEEDNLSAKRRAASLARKKFAGGRPSRERETAILSLRIDSALKRKLEEIARSEGVTQTALLERWIRRAR